MKTIGMITTALGATVLLLGIVVGVKSLPDIGQYLKMRSM